MILTRFAVIAWCAICAADATAHEFWIEPERYQVAEGDDLVARFKNGEAFEGVSLGYFERSVARYELIAGGTAETVTPRLGDNPALNLPAPADGLTVVIHETTPSFVTYPTWEKFQKFADHKDFADWRAQHTALGFSDPPFRERYTRHAKALIAVGDGRGQDTHHKMRTEFVALTNPYDSGFDGTMQVQVFDRDTPRARVQVEVFDRAPDDTVTITLYRTDENGIAAIPVTPGHAYLFDAVILEPIKDHDKAVWDTHWAALTFAVPAQ
ncbi:DUF4198 domain-containing protein [Tateyamaria sp. SN6-1]|uniref:DUF4198 domain-containing protein n=1 Tax=Tateyamaria sp. SN6-1 TaxID=3092148 RepID=UPI0039F58944